jgi:hypothetical protein
VLQIKEFKADAPSAGAAAIFDRHPDGMHREGMTVFSFWLAADVPRDLLYIFLIQRN